MEGWRSSTLVLMAHPRRRGLGASCAASLRALLTPSHALRQPCTPIGRARGWGLRLSIPRCLPPGHPRAPRPTRHCRPLPNPRPLQPPPSLHPRDRLVGDLSDDEYLPSDAESDIPMSQAGCWPCFVLRWLLRWRGLQSMGRLGCRPAPPACCRCVALLATRPCQGKPACCTASPALPGCAPYPAPSPDLPACSA